MKTIYFFIMLSSVSFLYGMERAPLISQKKEHYDSNPKIWPIRRCTDIMHMPMRDIKCSVAALKPFQQYMINRKLASSYTFNIAMLPKDLCLYILKKAYGDKRDDKLQENQIGYFCESMLRVSSLNKELRDNPIKIGDKEISLCAYLILSEQERNQLRSAINPSWANRFFEGKSEHVFSREDHAIVLQVLPDGIEVGQLVRLPSYWDRVKMGLCGDYKISDSGQNAILLGGFVAAQTFLTVGAIIASSGDNVVSSIMYSMGGVMDLAILSMGILHGMSRCRDHVVAQAHNNDGV